MTLSPRAAALECFAHLRHLTSRSFTKQTSQVSRWNHYFFEAAPSFSRKVAFLKVARDRWLVRFQDPKVPGVFRVVLLNGIDANGNSTGHPLMILPVGSVAEIERMAKHYKFKPVAYGDEFDLQPATHQAFVEQMNLPTTLSYEQAFDGGWKKVFAEPSLKSVSVVLPSRWSRGLRWGLGLSSIVAGVSIATLPVVVSDYSPALGFRVGPAISAITTRSGLDASRDFLDRRNLAKALFAFESISDGSPEADKALAQSLNGMGTAFYELPAIWTWNERVQQVNSWTATLSPERQAQFFMALEAELPQPTSRPFDFILGRGLTEKSGHSVSLEAVLGAVRWMPRSEARTRFLLRVLGNSQASSSEASKALAEQVLIIMAFDSQPAQTGITYMESNFRNAWGLLRMDSSSRIQLSMFLLFKSKPSREALPFLEDWKTSNWPIKFQTADDRDDFYNELSVQEGERPREALRRNIQALIDQIESKP